MIRVLIASWTLLFPLTLLGNSPELLLNKPVQSHIKWAKDTHNINLSYQGSSMPDGAIQAVFLGFSTEIGVGQKDARTLFVGCIEDLLCRINSDVNLRPWLFDYPFTAKNLGYSLALDGYKNGTVQPPCIAAILTAQNEIVYRVWDSAKNKRVDAFVEDYYDDNKAVKNGNASQALDSVKEIPRKSD